MKKIGLCFNFVGVIILGSQSFATGFFADGTPVHPFLNASGWILIGLGFLIQLFEKDK